LDAGGAGKRELGQRGEAIICQYIESKGMRLIERNFHCRGGEIDIIARDGDTVAFIEVKTRTNTNYGTAAEAVTLTKMRRITAAANGFIEKNGLHDNYFRFDVAEVYINGERENVDINYIKNAFESVMA